MPRNFPSHLPALAPRILRAGIAACIAVSAVAVWTLQTGPEVASPAAAPRAAFVPASPPVVDGVSGKILDRVGGELAEPVQVAAAVNSALHFASGLDLAVGPPVVVQARVLETETPKAVASAVPRAKAVAVARAMPLPPQRPAGAAPAIVAAVEEPGLLDRVLPESLQPSRLLPSGEGAWGRMATLGETLMQRLIP